MATYDQMLSHTQSRAKWMNDNYFIYPLSANEWGVTRSRASIKRLLKAGRFVQTVFPDGTTGTFQWYH